MPTHAELTRLDEIEAIDDRIAEMIADASPATYDDQTTLHLDYLRGRREALLDLADWLSERR